MIWKLFNTFLIASGGYAFAKLQEARRIPEGHVCFQIVTDLGSLPAQVLDHLEDALSRGARLMIGRVDDIVTVVAQNPDGSLAEFVEWVEEVEEALPPPPGPPPAPDGGGVIDVGVG